MGQLWKIARSVNDAQNCGARFRLAKNNSEFKDQNLSNPLILVSSRMYANAIILLNHLDFFEYFAGDSLAING